MCLLFSTQTLLCHMFPFYLLIYLKSVLGLWFHTLFCRFTICAQKQLYLLFHLSHPTLVV